MKLQLNNQLTFQETSGYPEDPAPMTQEEVKKQLMHWHDEIAKLGEETDYTPDLCDLEAFLYSLANCEVEYEHPFAEYSYYAGFEYCFNFDVIAESQEKADEKAIEKFKAMANKMPQQINDSQGTFKYLEQYKPNWGCADRIYED